MNLDQYVAGLQQQLTTAAAAGGDDARELAARLTAPLDAAARLALLSALSDAAGEISAELAPGSVDVRLRAGNPELVVTPPRATTTDPAPAPVAPPQVTEPLDTEGASTTRTTLRLPDHLKAQAEVAAARDGVSVNTWLVRAVAGALEQSSGRPAARPAQRGSGRVTGWVR